MKIVIVRSLAALGIATALILSFNSTPAVAQEVGFEIAEVEVFPDTAPKTPNYDVSSSGMNIRDMAKKSWFRMVVEYETMPEWIDELTFDYYVLMRPPEVEGQQEAPQPVVFHKKIDYVYIYEGDEHFSEVFMHPNSLRRFYDGDILEWAVLVSYKGREIAGESSRQGQGRWWEQFSVREGVLRNRHETPFAFINIEQYEEIKPAAR